jgi:hypothetical protein
VTAAWPGATALIFGIGPFPGFGVAGAGIAVTLYYCAAAVAMLRYMASGRSGLRLSLDRLRWPLFRDILKVGLLAALNIPASFAQPTQTRRLTIRSSPTGCRAIQSSRLTSING